MFALLLLLIPFRNLSTPRKMSERPNFAELVVYLLPENEWRTGETLQSQAFKDNKTSFSPGPMTSCLDLYHYNRLKEAGCNKKQLETAWKEWKKLGRFEHGEEYRYAIFDNLQPFGRARNLFEEIQNGLQGSEEERQKIYRRWIQKGLKEAAKSKDWHNFLEVQRDIIDVNLLARVSGDSGNGFSKIEWNKERLGNRIY
jgi:hypothetical protein